MTSQIPKMDQSSVSASRAMAPPTVPQRRGKYRKEDEWEAHRDLIANMYHQPGMKLKTIKEMLEQDHGFVVTDRQIKGKINKWQLGKNIQSSEMEFMVHKRQQRILKGKATRFRVRNQPVKQEKIERWQKRTGHTAQARNSPGPQTPSDISYSPASVRSPSLPNTGEWSLSSPTSSHARMNWMSEPDSRPLDAAVVESFAHISNEMGGTDLNQILALDESLFEGQSPAPFTPLPSPTPSPKLSLAGTPHARQPRNIATIQPHQAFTPQHPLRATAAPTEAVNATESRNGMFSNIYFSEQVSQEQPNSFESPRKKRYMEKEELDLRQRLEDFKSKFGSSHPATLDTMLRLAGVLNQQGRLRSAEALFKGVTETQYSISGQDDLKTIKAFVGLANNYIKQSKLSTAEKLLRWLHSKVPSVVSMSSPLNFQIKINLGTCLHMLSIKQEAEQLLRESIRIGGHVLKADDNLLLEPMEILAQILIFRGEFTEAEKILLAIVQAHDGLRGSADINTLDSRSALGDLYRMQGDFQKSEEILRQVLSDQERILGPEHESTLQTQRSLSSALSGQEKYQECEVLIKDAFEKFKKTLGRKHMSTLECERGVATAENIQQKYEEAEVTAKEVLAFSEEVLGFDHNVSCCALHELGRSYEGRNRLQEALLMYGESVERSTRSAGAEHPQTISHRNRVLRVQQNIDRSLTLTPALGGLWTPGGNHHLL